jgi:hypothetical protein
MRSLKDVGVREVARLRRRTLRLLAMGRVYPSDATYIVSRLDEVEAKIISMQEFNESGEEENG